MLSEIRNLFAELRGGTKECHHFDPDDYRVAAAALLVVSVVMSVTLLVPIANRSATWTADHHPADWREQSQRWDRLHYARVAIIVAGFVLTLVAGTVA